MSTLPDRWEFPHQLPRHAFSARDAARAGDVWRAFQEVAIEASTQAGWSPMRYRREGSAFVVHTMTVFHHREAVYGEPLHASTWIRQFKRGTLCTREVRLATQSEPVSSGTQQWVHVDSSLRPRRACAELVEAFPVREEGESVKLPEHEVLEGPEHVFELEAWYTWMDPLDHVNHPQYVDFCDEAVARVMARGGLRPLHLRPVAETMTFQRGVEAPHKVAVRTRLIGRTERAAVLSHQIEQLGDGGLLCAKGTTVRSLSQGDPDQLIAELMKA